MSECEREQADELWNQAYAAFEGHRRRNVVRGGVRVVVRDPDAQTTLNRIAAKCLRRTAASFEPANCAIRSATYKSSELALLERHNRDANPHRASGPIVVLEYSGRSVVIDGNRRVNFWIASGDPTSHEAIVITPLQQDLSPAEAVP